MDGGELWTFETLLEQWHKDQNVLWEQSEKIEELEQENKRLKICVRCSPYTVVKPGIDATCCSKRDAGIVRLALEIRDDQIKRKETRCETLLTSLKEERQCRYAAQDVADEALELYLQGYDGEFMGEPVEELFESLANYHKVMIKRKKEQDERISRRESG